MKNRTIEAYRLWDDSTWDTECVEIPADTPEESLQATCVLHRVREVARRDAKDVAH